MTAPLRRRFSVAAVAACLLGACAGPPPERVRVVALDEDGQHRLQDVVLETQPLLEQLWSDDIRMRGGGKIVIDGARFLDAGPGRLSAAEARRLAREDPGQQVAFRYQRLGDVAVPDDFESLMMASAYFGVERVRAFLREFDTSLATRSTAEICFNCGLYVDVGLVLPYLVSDNASYNPFADLFVLVPELVLSQMPIAADAAILCHEYSHRVVRYNLYRDRAFEQLLHAFTHQTELEPEDWRSLNLLKSLDEGSADLFAAVFSANPRFADAALGGLAEADRRDLEGERARQDVYGDLFVEAAAQNRALMSDPDGGLALGSAAWNPYHLGTMWAGALWRLGRDNDDGPVDVERLRSEVLPALVAALGQLGQGLGDDFTFDFDLAVGALINALPGVSRPQACLSLATTFPGPVAREAACP